MSNVDLNLLMIRGFRADEVERRNYQETEVEELLIAFRQDSKLPLDFTTAIARGMDLESVRTLLDNLRDLPPQTSAVISALYVRN